MSEQKRILIVEDDESIRNLTRMHLKMNNFNEVYSVSDGESALLLAPRINPNVILLDLMLPGIGGLEVLRSIRKDPLFQKTAVIIITAKGEDEDVVNGLESGADDYLAKPFSVEVLLARIRVQLRKLAAATNLSVISLDSLEMDVDTRIVKLNGKKIAMTADEFDTLYLLVSNPEKVFTRRQIINLVKGGDYPANDRIVDIRMMKIRRKLNEWAEHLHTVRGVGYKITGF